MKKKFFLISQVFYPDQVSTAGLFTNLCSEIAKNEINVTVWCAQPSYNARKRQASKLVYNNISIRYLTSTNFNKNILPGRLINYITFSVSLILRFLFTKEKTTVFCSTNPPYLGFLVAILCSLKKRKFNYIIQDVFPDGLIRLKKVPKKGIIARVWNSINKYTLKRSNKIIIIGRDMRDWVSVTSPKSLDKTIYIPIWQDGNLVTPIEYNKNDFVLEHNLQNRFTVQYSGNMGMWNDMQTFGLAVDKLSKENVFFTFIGDGIRKKELENSLLNNTSANVAFFPFQPKERLGQTLTACHIALVSLNKGLEGIAVPSKIMGILAAGVPAIALVPTNSEIAMIIYENNCGYIIEPGNVEELVDRILKLKNDNSLRLKMGQNARKAFEKKYSTKVISKEYIKLL